MHTQCFYFTIKKSIRAKVARGLRLISKTSTSIFAMIRALVEAKPPVNVVKSNVSSSNKAGQGNLLSRLLCCFRPGVSQSSDTLQQLNNHSSNLNGSSKSGKRNGYKSQSVSICAFSFLKMKYFKNIPCLHTINCSMKLFKVF